MQTDRQAVKQTYSRKDWCSWSRRQWENSGRTVADRHDSF